MNRLSFLNLSDAAVGIILKELVRRALVTIRGQRFSFEEEKKHGYGGELDDVRTSADTESQKVYAKSLRECFPGVGLIGEEENLSEPCSLEGVDAYFTIDPLDGTKAYIRRQSHGTATMIALVVEGEVVSAWIGDVNTLEVYGFRPGSEKVHRISEFEVSRPLHDMPRQLDLAESYLLLRTPLASSPESVIALGRYFKKNHSDGGSIGAWMARLWKGEFSCAVMAPNHQTPWDDTPIIGISQKLGFTFLRSSGEGSWEVFQPSLVRSVEPRDYWIAVIHESNLNQLSDLLIEAEQTTVS